MKTKEELLIEALEMLIYLNICASENRIPNKYGIELLIKEIKQNGTN